MFLKLSKFFIYLSVFSVVIVLTSTFFPFIGGKYYFFRVCVELALIFFLLFWAFEAQGREILDRFRKISREPLFIATSLFVLFYLLASIFAYNSHAAFWSNYERGEGGFQMFHYYIFFVLLLLILKEPKEWKNLFISSVVAAVSMIGYGLLANLGLVSQFIDPFMGEPPSGFLKRLIQPRFQGSLGNPAYVAPYLMFAMFYGAYLWISSKWRKNWRRHLFFGALILFFLSFLILSQTRGAFLGLAIAILIGLIYLIISFPAIRKKTLIILAVLIFIGGLLIGSRHNSFVKNLPGGRFFEIFDLGVKTDTVQTRFWTWGSAWASFKERPILGWGPENFSAAFDKYFDIRHYSPGKNSETWFDRAHSVIFDYLAETGLLGFLSYLSIFVIFYWRVFSRPKNKSEMRANSLEPSGDLNFRNNFLLQTLFVILPIGYLVKA